MVVVVQNGFGVDLVKGHDGSCLLVYLDRDSDVILDLR